MVESGRIPKDPGEYKEMVEPVRVPKNFPGQYLKRVESVWVSENDRIRAITEKS